FGKRFPAVLFEDRALPEEILTRGEQRKVVQRRAQRRKQGHHGGRSTPVGSGCQEGPADPADLDPTRTHGRPARRWGYGHKIKTTRAIRWIARVGRSPRIPEGVRGGGTPRPRDRRAASDRT